MQASGNVLGVKAKPLLHGMDLKAAILAGEHYVEPSHVIS